MAENTNITDEIHEESTHSGHHHHHHHHHTHRPHHKSGRHHHRFGHLSGYRSSKSFTRSVKAAMKKAVLRMSAKSLPSGRKFKKIANNTKQKKESKYITYSKRVLFCAVIIVAFIYSFWYLSQENDDTAFKTAGTTPSETSQLKSQIVQLEYENSLLQEKLDRYIAIYGELEDGNDADNNSND